MTDAELAGFATARWVENVGAVPAEEIPAMVCEDPSIVTCLVGALRHARAERDAALRMPEQVSSWLLDRARHHEKRQVECMEAMRDTADRQLAEDEVEHGWASSYGEMWAEQIREGKWRP